MDWWLETKTYFRFLCSEFCNKKTFSSSYFRKCETKKRPLFIMNFQRIESELWHNMELQILLYKS